MTQIDKPPPPRSSTEHEVSDTEISASLQALGCPSERVGEMRRYIENKILEMKQEYKTFGERVYDKFATERNKGEVPDRAK